MEKHFGFRLFLTKALPIGIILILFYVGSIGFILYALMIGQVKSNLESLSSRIKEDLVISEGEWDLSRYSADNHIFDTNPLYIISSEGYILERSRPIHGLLDLSRFTLISQYSSPETVKAVTNESWRVLSASTSAQQSVGAILATVYEPRESDLPEIDKQLGDVLKKVQSQISINGDVIDVSKVDARQFPYDVSFQVVTRFNKVLFQSNNINSVTRMPVFIDRSYIDSQLKGSPYKQVKDSEVGTEYLTLTTPLLNENNLTAGIIVVGMPIDPIYIVLKQFAILGLSIGLIVLFFVFPLSYKYIKSIRRSAQDNLKQKILPKVITFNKKDCKLIINNQFIDIPYSSHQYFFCLAIFQKPQKKWEVDELLEVLGEDFGPEKWRKIYDTMVALNKKTGHVVDKLFIVRDKRYFLNTQFTSLIKIET